LIPDNVDDVSAAGIPVAYLTAQVALTLAGFRRQNCSGTGDRRINRQCGDAIGARLGRKTRDLKHDQSYKSEQAKALGFNEVIDTSLEKLGDASVALRMVTAQTLSLTDRW